MGTGVTFSLSPPDYLVKETILLRKTNESYFALQKALFPQN
jgi:hypothetical protein